MLNVNFGFFKVFFFLLRSIGRPCFDSLLELLDWALLGREHVLLGGWNLYFVLEVDFVALHYLDFLSQLLNLNQLLLLFVFRPVRDRISQWLPSRVGDGTQSCVNGELPHKGSSFSFFNSLCLYFIIIILDRVAGLDDLLDVNLLRLESFHVIIVCRHGPRSRGALDYFS